jgi:tetratricopeptide (TPR) repeat protein
LTGRAAQTFAELGALDRARALFAEAVSADPTGRIGALHFDYARLLLRQNDFKEARQVLRTVFRNPATADMEVLVAWLSAVGRLEEPDSELAAFALGGQRLIAARHAIFAELEQSGRTRAALSMVEEHPEMLVQNFSARVRTAATGAELFAEAAALFERVMAQSPLNATETASELALLYADWAEAELRGLQIDPALEHLKRAHQLRADLWPVAERLSGIHLDRGELVLAAQTLRAFLAASASSPDREKARQLLARIER